MCMSTSMVKGLENDTIFSSQTSLAWCFPIFFVVSSDETFWRKIAGILKVSKALLELIQSQYCHKLPV